MLNMTQTTKDSLSHVSEHYKILKVIFINLVSIFSECTKDKILLSA